MHHSQLYRVWLSVQLIQIHQSIIPVSLCVPSIAFLPTKYLPFVDSENFVRDDGSEIHLEAQARHENKIERKSQMKAKQWFISCLWFED
jgi:hypothetical protein